MTQDAPAEPEQPRNPIPTADEASPARTAPGPASPPRSPGKDKKPAAVLGLADIVAAAVLAVLAALVAVSLPGGSQVRALVTLPVLLVAPGYLLLQAAVGSQRAGQRLLHALIACGVSPPLVGLLALLTAALPGGFHSGAIIATVTLACLGLGVVAVLRRRRVAAVPPTPVPAN